MIDQTRLPTKLSYVTFTTAEQVATAIRTMVVRGAPAIGVSAAMGLALAAVHSRAKNLPDFVRELEYKAMLLRMTRPTAVNLFWESTGSSGRLGEPARSAKPRRKSWPRS